MQTQEVHFSVTKQDFRAANYYIAYTNKKPLFVTVIGLLAAYVVYMVLVQLGVLKFWVLGAYLMSLAVFWLIWQMTKVERAIRAYMRSKDCLLYKKSILRFTDTRMTLRIPENGFNSSGMFADFPCAFETRTAFLVYASGADLFLIPLRAFKDQQKELFRNILAGTMGNRFVSRFNRHAPHIPTAAETEADAYNKAKAAEQAAAKEAEKAHKLAVKEAKKEGRDLLAEEAKAAEEAAAVAGPNFKPRRRSIADRANLVNNRGKNAEKKH